MTGSPSLSVTLDEAGALALRDVIATDGQSQSRLMKRNNLTGDEATWIVIATLSVQALPHVLTFLQSLLGARKVKRIKFDDIEIENPTAEDLKLYREWMRSRMAAPDA